VVKLLLLFLVALFVLWRISASKSAGFQHHFRDLVTHADKPLSSNDLDQLKIVDLCWRNG